MKLLCRPDYYTEHRDEILEFVKHKEDIIFTADLPGVATSFDYFLIDNDTARKISLHVSEVYDSLLRNTNLLSKEIEDRVNYETTQRFYLPKFNFQRPE